MNHEPRTLLLGLALLAALGCRRAAPTDERPPEPLGRSEPATLAGEIEISAELANGVQGSVTIRAWRAGETGREGALPLLARSYELDDPDWIRGPGGLVRYFGLCDADRVGDPARKLPAELELEASLDPSGPGGVHALARARARNGAKDVVLEISANSDTAQPPAPRKKGG